LRIVYENDSQHRNECGNECGLMGRTLRIVYENESQHRNECGNECGLMGRTLRIVYENESQHRREEEWKYFDSNIGVAGFPSL